MLQYYPLQLSKWAHETWNLILLDSERVDWWCTKKDTPEQQVADAIQVGESQCRGFWAPLFRRFPAKGLQWQGSPVFQQPQSVPAAHTRPPARANVCCRFGRKKSKTKENLQKTKSLMSIISTASLKWWGVNRICINNRFSNPWIMTLHLSCRRFINIKARTPSVCGVKTNWGSEWRGSWERGSAHVGGLAAVDSPRGY